MLEEAAAPLAGNSLLCQALLQVRQSQEITIDGLTSDALTFAGPRLDQACHARNTHAPLLLSQQKSGAKPSPVSARCLEKA